jgi:integrase
MDKTMGQLTDKGCRGKPKKAREIWNDHDNGLALVVTMRPNGEVTRRWRFQYYRPGVRNKKGQRIHNDLTLGYFDEVSLGDARAKAREYADMVREGKDPSHHRALTGERQALEQTPLAEVCGKYLAHLESLGENRRRKSTLKQYRVRLHAIERGDLARLPIGPLAIDLRAFERWPLKLVAQGKLAQARTVCQFLGYMFEWAAPYDYCQLGANPARHVLRQLETPKRKGFRAVTDPEQVGELLRAIHTHKNPVLRMAMEFLALTFVRSHNVCNMEWSEIDWDKALWTISGSKMKMDRPHTVSLSRQALTILRAMQPITGGQQYVFSSYGGLAPLGHVAFFRVIRRVGWGDRHSAHGFRSTASTLLRGDTEHAFRPADIRDAERCKEAIELQLAHGNPDKIEAAYNRNDMMRIRAELMRWWADRIDLMRDGERLRLIA